MGHAVLLAHEHVQVVDEHRVFSQKATPLRRFSIFPSKVIGSRRG